jgi:hypothetical protein
MIRNRKPIAGAGAALAALLALRFLYLVRRPIWFDEIFTLWITPRPLAQIAAALRVDSGSPLPYVLEKPFVWAAAAAHRDVLARLLSWCALALLFPLNLIRRFSGGRTFALLAALCPLLIFYSGEARVYAVLALASFCLFLAVCRSRNSSRAVLAAGALAAALPYLHYLGLFVLAGSSAICLARRKWAFLGAQLAGACAFLPWLPVALRQPPIAWARQGIVSDLLRLLQSYGFWMSAPGYFSAASLSLPAAGSAVGACLLVAAFAASRLIRSVRDALVFAFSPIFLAALISVVRPAFFPGRTEIVTLPVALWAFSRAAKRSSIVKILCGGAAALGSGTIALALLDMPAESPYAVTARFLTRTAREGDVVIAADANYLPLLLDSDRKDLKAQLFAFPQETAKHPGWFEAGRVADPILEKTRLESLLDSASRRIFLAIPPDPPLRNFFLPLLAGRRVMFRQIPGGYAVGEVLRSGERRRTSDPR